MKAVESANSRRRLAFRTDSKWPKSEKRPIEKLFQLYIPGTECAGELRPFVCKCILSARCFCCVRCLLLRSAAWSVLAVHTLSRLYFLALDSLSVCACGVFELRVRLFAFVLLLSCFWRCFLLFILRAVEFVYP